MEEPYGYEMCALIPYEIAIPKHLKELNMSRIVRDCVLRSILAIIIPMDAGLLSNMVCSPIAQNAKDHQHLFIGSPTVAPLR